MRKPDWKMTTVCLVALAWPVLGADLTKFKDWDHSPEYVYLATDAEKKEWKNVKADEEAEKFVTLFWAKRDPDIKTPANEYKARFDALVAKADELFKLGRRRGALTERGRAFVLIGPPKSIGRLDMQAGGAPARPAVGAPGSSMDQMQMDSSAPGAQPYVHEFNYDVDQLPAWTEMKLLKLHFRVEPSISSETAQESSQLKKLSAKAAQAALVNPNLKELPVYKTREQVEAEMKVAAEAAAEKERGPELTPSVRQALEAVLAKETGGAVAPFGIAYRDGATRLMVQIHAPASAVQAPDTVKLAILVRSKDGKDAVRREEPAKLMKSKDDLFADRAVPVVPGDFDVAAALLDGSGAVIAAGHRPASVAPLPAEFGVSPLLLAYGDVDLPGLKPDDPYVFAQRKFLTRGDHRLDSKKDGLSYVVRVYNPGVDPVTRKTALKRSIRIKPKTGGAAQEVPLPPEDQTVIPEVKGAVTANVVDLAGSVVDVNLGDYFLPGDFELRIRVSDENLKKSVDVTAPFTLVGPPPAARKK